jgi:hypothetical protein
MKQESTGAGRTAFDEFCEFAGQWLPEVELVDVAMRTAIRGPEIDVFYREGRSRKELVWAGDGVQIFLQLLWHVHRLAAFPTIVLDEPDVYLHADLQRRLIRLLETFEAQIILATHSAEIVTEAPPASVIWLDRSRKRAVASPTGKALEDLSSAIGSHFNLRLARLLRSKVAVFVEGQDARLLRHFARSVGATAFVSEGLLTVVPLDGSTNRARLDGFKWVVENLLEKAIEGWVLLDRDFRSDDEALLLAGELEAAGLNPHIWQRHEIENYVLVPTAIARRSGAPIASVTEMLDIATLDMKDEVLPEFVASRQREAGNKGKAPTTVMTRCLSTLGTEWPDPAFRLAFCPGKEVLSHLNDALQASGFKAVTALGLAGEIRSSEIDDELRAVLTRIHRATTN